VTEQEISEVKEMLSSKHAGPLRNMFYQRNGLPRQALYTNRKLFEKLGILNLEINSLEEEGLLRILGVSLAKLRGQAKGSNLPWVDIEYTTPGGARIAHHGFSNDINVLIANAEKFDEIADRREAAAEMTRKIVEQQKKLLKAG